MVGRRPLTIDFWYKSPENGRSIDAGRSFLQNSLSRRRHRIVESLCVGCLPSQARIIHEFVGRTEQTPFVPERRSLF